MNEIKIELDIQLICVRAESFPQGVPETFRQLAEKLSNIEDRECFGLYEKNEDGISYRAAFSRKDDDVIANDLESFRIEKGNYLGCTISNWQDKIESIGPAFDKIFEDERVDKNGISIEMYKGENDLICMVKMKS